MPNSKLKSELDDLKNRLAQYSATEVRRVTDRLDNRNMRERCFHKIKNIDDKYGVCRGVNVFVDLCGGPGQFAKYVYSVNGDACAGYGVTLRNKCDYRFAHRNFRKIYGCFDTGDLFDANVQFELMYFCRGKCDLVLADGAFDVAGRENDQEILTLSLLRKECHVILEVLRVGGHCVLKIFDTFNRATISILQNFVAHFEEYHLYKPACSRVANSEKYLVCKGRTQTPVEHTTRIDALARKFALNQKRALKRLLVVLQNEHHESPSRAAVAL
jgi:23S rRNA U2552 (ribose-2'-O)-methylase RlmE/FtsJ